MIKINTKMIYNFHFYIFYFNLKLFFFILSNPMEAKFTVLLLRVLFPSNSFMFTPIWIPRNEATMAYRN